MREVLDAASERIADKFEDQPETGGFDLQDTRAPPTNILANTKRPKCISKRP